MIAMPSIGFQSVDQVAVVVRNLDAAMERYWTQFGIGPWDVYIYGPARLSRMTFRGNEQPYRMKLALATIGTTMYELIEALDGPTTYREFMEAHGEGLHHLGYFVDDIDAEIARMAELGYPLLQSGYGFGVDGDGAYAYFETERDLGCIIEAITPPRQMPVPEYVYPSQRQFPIQVTGNSIFSPLSPALSLVATGEVQESKSSPDVGEKEC